MTEADATLSQPSERAPLVFGPFEYHHHVRTVDHLNGLSKPMKVRDHLKTDTPVARFNSKFGLGITLVVGTMWAAYLFTAIALLSVWQAVTSHNLVIIVAWISSNFLQLVLLPIIIVGQNIQAKASDKRAVDTYNDAEAVLHEALQIQAHLATQDAALSELLATVGASIGPGAGATSGPGAGVTAGPAAGTVPPPAPSTGS